MGTEVLTRQEDKIDHPGHALRGTEAGFFSQNGNVPSWPFVAFKVTVYLESDNRVVSGSSLNIRGKPDSQNLSLTGMNGHQ